MEFYMRFEGVFCVLEVFLSVSSKSAVVRKIVSWESSHYVNPSLKWLGQSPLGTSTCLVEHVKAISSDDLWYVSKNTYLFML